jgi:hypothetical protein
VIVLVVVVTSLMAPPTLRFAMARVEQGEKERLRKIDHDTWQGRRPADEPAAPSDPREAADDGCRNPNETPGSCADEHGSAQMRRPA